jgi:hypothetical protein
MRLAFRHRGGGNGIFQEERSSIVKKFASLH